MLNANSITKFPIGFDATNIYCGLNFQTTIADINSMVSKLSAAEMLNNIQKLSNAMMVKRFQPNFVWSEIDKRKEINER